jgi:hypothetical protein
MKPSYHILGAMLIVLATANTSRAVVLIDETFDPGYARTTQNIAGDNMAVYKGRSGTTATVGSGSLSFSAASSAGASQYWSYFTDPAANIGTTVQNGHAIVGIGETLSVSVKFSLSAMPTDTTTYPLRFGLFDDAGTRQTADLGSGGNSTAWVNNLGYAVFLPLTSQSGLSDQLSIRNRTTLTAGNIFSAGGDFTQIGSLVGGTYNPLASATDYIFTFSVYRQDAGTSILTASLTDAAMNVMTAGSVANTGTQLSSFDWLAWRPPTETAGGTITFTEMKVELTSAVVPEPSSAALAGLAAFLGVTLFRRKQS